MSDNVYLEALQNYLTGQEWRESVQTFVLANCKYFNNLKDLSHQHHIIWKRFQEVVESVLEMALANIGGSIDLLESAIDEIMLTPSRGPRDDVKKSILRDLNTCADFQEFSDMMQRTYRETVSGNCSDAADNNYDILFKMGFSLSAIEIVTQDMRNPDAQESLEELVMRVSEYESTHAAHQESKQQQQQQQSSPPPPGSMATASSAAVAAAKYISSDSGSKNRDSKRSGAVHGGVYDQEGHLLTEQEAIAAHSSYSPYAHLDKFALEAGMSPEEGAELHAKFLMSDSVLESFSLDGFGDVAPTGLGGGSSVPSAVMSSAHRNIEQLMNWAAAMRDLHTDIQLAHQEGILCSEVRLHDPQGLIEWFRALERTRQEIDEDSIAGNMLSDVELKRMAQLDRIAEQGDRSADERALHGLLSSHSDTRAEIDSLHRQFGLLVMASGSRAKHGEGKAIRRENLEELYLLLKEQVQSGADLADIVDEMHETVYSLVSCEKGSEVVSKLLDLHILEEEEILLRSQIQAIVGKDVEIEGSGGLSTLLGDVDVSISDLSECAGATGVRSASDAKAASIAKSNSDFKRGAGGVGDIGVVTASPTVVSTPPSFTAGDAAVTTAAAPRSPRMFDSDAKSSAALTVADTGEFVSSPLKGYDDSAAAAKRAQVDTADTFTTLLKETPPDADSADRSAAFAAGTAAEQKFSPGKRTKRDEDAFLFQLRKEQKAALKALEESLQAEKHRKLSNIEDKLRRRKMQLMQQQAKLKNSASEEEKKEAEQLCSLAETEVAEVEGELEVAKEDTETWSAGCVSGFKKRCIAETKKIKQIAVQAMEASVDGDRIGAKPVYCKLTKAQQDEVQSDVARAMRERFERDQAALLEALEAQRAKQKKRIQSNLAKRKADASSSGGEKSGLMMMEWKARAEIEMMHARMDEEESLVLARAQASTLAAMSALYMERGLLEPAQESEDALDAEDNDHLDSPSHGGGSRGRSQLRQAWLQHADEVRDGYVAAGKQLQTTLRSAQRKARAATESSTEATTHTPVDSAEAVLEELDEEDALNGVTTHMMKVINEAFVGNLMEETAEDTYADRNKRLSSSAARRHDAMRVKAGILEEFEKAKEEYDRGILSAQARSKAQWEARRNSRRADAKAGALNEADLSPQILLESVMDSFLAETELGSSAKSALAPVAAVAVADSKASAPVPAAGTGSGAGAGFKTESSTSARTDAAKSAPFDDELAEANAVCRIRSAHETKAKSLEEVLKAEMLAKKKVLENRLKARKAAGDCEGDVGAAKPQQQQQGAVEGEEEIEEIWMDAEEDLALKRTIRGLEYAYNTIAAMLKNKDSDEPAPDVSQLLSIMDKLAQGTSDGEAFTVMGHVGNSSLGGGQDVARIVADERRKSAVETRNNMEEEVKLISLKYNEEKQKLDLKLKMQQTRQKQWLQKKLTERQQAKSKQQVDQYGDTEAMDHYQHRPELQQQLQHPDRIVIGASQSPKKYGPSNAQPVFKGLDASANFKTTAGGMSSMSSRGMNLGPMMGKRK